MQALSPQTDAAVAGAAEVISLLETMRGESARTTELATSLVASDERLAATVSAADALVADAVAAVDAHDRRVKTGLVVAATVLGAAATTLIFVTVVRMRRRRATARGIAATTA